MQYFIGFKEYTDCRPFDPSTLVDYRKRLDDEVMNRIIERSFLDKAAGNEEEEDDEQGTGGDDQSMSVVKESEEDADEETEGESEEENKGTLIIDASCMPADIAYPTDLELCDKARRWTEVILDHYWKIYGALVENGKKPRTYREKARKRFLNLNKRKKNLLPRSGKNCGFN